MKLMTHYANCVKTFAFILSSALEANIALEFPYTTRRKGAFLTNSNVSMWRVRARVNAARGRRRGCSRALGRAVDAIPATWRASVAQSLSLPYSVFRKHASLKGAKTLAWNAIIVFESAEGLAHSLLLSSSPSPPIRGLTPILFIYTPLIMVI